MFLDHSGISDLLDLITADNDAAGVVDYDYKISGGDAVVGESTETEVDEDFVYPDIDYQEKEVETTDEDTKESIEDILEDDETEIVWIPVVVEYDYEIVETKDILEIFENADTQLDYQEDQTYQLFVQKALDTSVQFESIYQEQRIFNIILLSGIKSQADLSQFHASRSVPDLPDRDVRPDQPRHLHLQQVPLHQPHHAWRTRTKRKTPFKFIIITL